MKFLKIDKLSGYFMTKKLISIPKSKEYWKIYSIGLLILNLILYSGGEGQMKSAQPGKLPGGACPPENFRVRHVPLLPLPLGEICTFCHPQDPPLQSVQSIVWRVCHVTVSLALEKLPRFSPRNPRVKM